MTISGYIFGLTTDNRAQVFNSIENVIADHRYQLRNYLESEARLKLTVEDLNPARSESILELSNSPDEPEELIVFIQNESRC
ncbi:MULTISPECIES: hypothetical protein [unclassified Neptuniibacter]|uniref:hypothetical protein n=1 Tax=unclassified Neptuniibacter TaxID=2630693 RepID=UPI000C56B350|nr:MULTISPECIES: hypothetical protein [unclassified Neptuniibacter]MAY42560.1 hypothetical protein [Oceanospirillaceae bacterium]|tara:strand:- start:41182 stop:41427 length:246 start_codon:yes stop_codon:yes gene_type:complete